MKLVLGTSARANLVVALVLSAGMACTSSSASPPGTGGARAGAGGAAPGTGGSTSPGSNGGAGGSASGGGSGSGGKSGGAGGAAGGAGSGGHGGASPSAGGAGGGSPAGGSGGADAAANPDVGLPPVQGDELFVSTSGSDSNPGTKDQPFKSISAAQAAVRTHPDRGKVPITVTVLSGTYYVGKTVVFTSADSGTQAAPVTYRGGGTAILSGGVSLGSLTWSAYKNGIMQATVPASRTGCE